jgi:Sec-independent protein translocase protein TatA
MIPGIGSMGGAELLILLVVLLNLFFGAERLPAPGSFGIGTREFRRGAARLGDEEDDKQRPRSKEDGKEIAPNAGKGEGSV